MSSIYDEVLTEMKKIAKKELPRLNARCMKLISEDISKMENIDTYEFTMKMETAVLPIRNAYRVLVDLMIDLFLKMKTDGII